MDGTSAIDIAAYLHNDHRYELPEIFPKSANQFTLHRLFEFCLEDDSCDDTVQHQKRKREQDLKCCLRNLLDDAFMCNWMLHLFNCNLEDRDEIDSKNLPIWVDNITFLQSETRFHN